MKLNPGFSIEKYDLKATLVTEDDAAFIATLRSDQDRTKFMLTLSTDIQQQKRWLQEYKIREREGRDYYFIYHNLEGEPIGLNRVSQIDYNNLTCKACSWIKRKGSKFEAMAMFVIWKEIIFDVLGMESFIVDVHKDNYRALKYWANLNPEKIREENNFNFYKIDKARWYEKRNWFYGNCTF